MKKSLIALAALATVATAAQAQSSVSVYGILDLNVKSTDTKGTGRATIASDSSLSQSRLGFRGTEDLGGGLKSEFQLESKLTPVDGVAGAGTASTASSVLFNREAWVGIASNLGSVRAGFTDVSDAVNIDVTVSQIAELGTASELGTDKARVVRYTTPVFNGLSAQYGFASTGSTTDELTTGNISSAVVKYEAGALGLYAGFEDKKISSTYNQKQSMFGAKYDFGVASVGAYYSPQGGSTQTNDDTYGDLKQTRITVAIPVTSLAGITLHAGYLKNESERGTRSSATNHGGQDYTDYRVAVTKAFSKRTTGYLAYIDTDYKDASTADTKTAVVGIRHSF